MKIYTKTIVHNFINTSRRLFVTNMACIQEAHTRVHIDESYFGSVLPLEITVCALFMILMHFQHKGQYLKGTTQNYMIIFSDRLDTSVVHCNFNTFVRRMLCTALYLNIHQDQVYKYAVLTLHTFEINTK